MTCQGLAVRLMVQLSVIPDCILVEMALSLLLRAPQSFTLQSSSNWQRPRVSVSVMLTLRGNGWWNIKHRLTRVKKCASVGGWCGRRGAECSISAEMKTESERKRGNGQWSGNLKQRHSRNVTQLGSWSEKISYVVHVRDRGEKEKKGMGNTIVW